MSSANEKTHNLKMEESSRSDKYNCFVYTLQQTGKNTRMTRRDIEEHPKLVIDDTGSESFYEQDLKPSVEYESGSYNSTSLVPDIDKPRGPSPDVPSKPLASKKLFMNRYESELKAQPRPNIIQWAPSKGYQPSLIHNHVKDSLNISSTTATVVAHISTAVTSSVPVHSTPLMADWTKDTQNEKLEPHIHHSDNFQVDTEIKLGTKFHCKEGPEGKAGDLTSARHKETFAPNFTTARNTSEEALDLSMSRKTPSPANSCYSRPSSPSTPTASSMPLTPNSSVSFTEKFKALSTKEDFTQLHKQSGYVDLNRIKEIYTHNISAMVKSQAHEPKWNGNIQNPNTTKIYPRATLSNGVKAAPVTVNVQNTESGKMYQCQLCNVMFKHRHHVVRHMRSHTGEKPFQCMECGARFARKCILTNHMRVHTGEKPFICRECGDMFSRKHHLVIHVRTHTGEKPYFCGKCGAAFSRSHHLGRHMKTHEPKQGLDGTVNAVEQYQCSKCNAKFAHANSLSRHVKMHNDPNFNSKFMSPASTATIPTTDTSSTLSLMNSPSVLPSNTYTPFSTSSLYYKLDSIPVPRMDVVIPPSSGFKPLILSSVSLEHSTIVKEECND